MASIPLDAQKVFDITSAMTVGIIPGHHNINADQQKCFDMKAAAVASLSLHAGGFVVVTMPEWHLISSAYNARP